MMLVCGVLIQVCGVASAFVTDYVLYLVFRFFVAMFEHSCYQVAFVLGKCITAHIRNKCLPCAIRDSTCTLGGMKRDHVIIFGISYLISM